MSKIDGAYGRQTPDAGPQTDQAREQFMAGYPDWPTIRDSIFGRLVSVAAETDARPLCPP